MTPKLTMTPKLNFDPHTPAFMTTLCRMAVEAGAAIMAHYHNGVAVEIKSDKSPVTQADRDAETLLTQGLAALVPDIQVIGEEACSIALPDKVADCFFLLDPLDGTRDFVARRQDFTVNIGLVEGDAPVAGVIYAPMHEKLYFSGHHAAYMMALAPDETPDLSKAKILKTRPINANGVRVIASRAHRAKETDRFISRLHVTQTIGASSSYKFCLLAEDKADIYPRHGRTMEWDTAAGQAILQSAGGVVTREDGTALTYGKLARGLDNPSFIAAGTANWQDAEK